MVEKDVQKRVLRGMYISNNPIKVKQIMEATNLNYNNVAGGIRHLCSRGLVIKKIQLSKAAWKNPPHKKATYTLRQSLMPKILKLISEIEE